MSSSAGAMKMTPDGVSLWFRVLRDIATFVLGVTVLLYELIGQQVPDKFWVGTGVMLMGVAPVLQLNRAILKGEDHEKDDPKHQKSKRTGKSSDS